MKYFQYVMVCQQGLQMVRLGAPAGNLDDIGAAVAGRQLDDAEAVPVMVEPHGFGIDGNRIAVAADIRQIAPMQANRHDCISEIAGMAYPPSRVGTPVRWWQALENK